MKDKTLIVILCIYVWIAQNTLLEYVGIISGWFHKETTQSLISASVQESIRGDIFEADEPAIPIWKTAEGENIMLADTIILPGSGAYEENQVLAVSDETGELIWESPDTAEYIELLGSNNVLHGDPAPLR